MYFLVIFLVGFGRLDRRKLVKVIFSSKSNGINDTEEIDSYVFFDDAFDIFKLTELKLGSP